MKMRKVLTCFMSMALCVSMLAGCSGGTSNSKSVQVRERNLLHRQKVLKMGIPISMRKDFPL